MFCGSCMHDNTLARALLKNGQKVTLVPTYTPIRVDEENVSQSRVLLGGLNIYLNAESRVWRNLPSWLKGWLDSPSIIRFATKFAVSADAQKLGRLMVALLEGEAGPERDMVAEFARSLGRDIRPDAILFTNALLVGTLRELKREFRGPILCFLQGDDIFLNDLVEPFRGHALALIRERAQQFDGFLTHSEYYREYMGDLLQIPRGKIHRVPLGIDLIGHTGTPNAKPHQPFTVGYFARICPEKGLHRLVEAFRLLHAKYPQTKLRAGGYLGVRDQAYFDRLRRETADLGSAFEYIGSPAGHLEKVQFLQSLDVLSVPTEYHEPKGLSVLEALANGVPVVQPRHGAFPEVLSATGGGLLVEPLNADDLAQKLEHLLLNPEERFALAEAGQTAVREKFGTTTMVAATLRVLTSLVQKTN